MATKTLDKFTKAELIGKFEAQRSELLRMDSLCAQQQADIVRLKAELTALDSRRRYEALSYRAKTRANSSATVPPRRTDWSALAQQYCTEHGVRSVSRSDLRAYAQNARETQHEQA